MYFWFMVVDLLSKRIARIIKPVIKPTREKSTVLFRVLKKSAMIFFPTAMFVKEKRKVVRCNLRLFFFITESI